MYEIYMDGDILPVTPGKLQIKINNQNKTINLINESEVNILKDPGLTEITFDARLPNVPYSFAADTSHQADYYLKRFEKFKTGKKNFRFIVSRITDSDHLHDTNMRVSLEDYTIKEDAAEGTDSIVTVKLKQYKNYGTKIVVIKPQPAALPKVAPAAPVRDAKAPPSTYTVKPNDGFWLIAKQTLGDGSRMHDVAAYNGMTINSTIHPGNVLRIPPK